MAYARKTWVGFALLAVAVVASPRALANSENLTPPTCNVFYRAIEKAAGRKAADALRAARIFGFGIVAASVASSYQEEVTGLYDELVKKPFRALVKGIYRDQKNYQAQVVKLGELAGELQNPQGGELTLAAANQRVKAIFGNLEIEPAEISKADESAWDRTSERLISLSLAYADAKEKSATAIGSRKRIFDDIQKNTTREYAEILATWNLLEALPGEKPEIGATTRSRLAAGNEFFADHLPAEVYFSALGQKIQQLIPKN